MKHGNRAGRARAPRAIGCSSAPVAICINHAEHLERSLLHRLSQSAVLKLAPSLCTRVVLGASVYSGQATVHTQNVERLYKHETRSGKYQETGNTDECENGVSGSRCPRPRLGANGGQACAPWSRRNSWEAACAESVLQLSPDSSPDSS